MQNNLKKQLQKVLSLLTVFSIVATMFAMTASGVASTDDIHAEIEYTVPVLTTENVTGNTIHSLAHCQSNWSKYFTTDPSNLENNTGIHCDWTYDACNGVQNGINQLFKFDGVSVKLANVGNASNPGSKRFALVFSSKSKNPYSATNGVLRILFNGRLGYATAAANEQSVNILGDDTATATDEKNAIFKNMSDKTVYVDIAKKADDTGDYAISLTIGDDVLTDTLPASLLEGLDFDPAGECYVSLSAVNITGQAPTTIDFLGVGCYSEWKDIELDNPNLCYHGRTFDVNGAVGIDWSNSGVSFNVKASEVYMTFKAQTGSDSTQGNRAYFWVYINGERSKKILLTSGENTYDIATDLNPEEITEISVIKSTEATFSYADLMGIRIKGKLVEYKNKTKKIEVIGDSISAGYGILSEAGATGFRAVEEDSTYTYAALLADKFDAELSLLASSGSGVFMDSSGLVSGETSSSGKPANIWADMYDYSVVARGQRGSAQSITKEWDFTNDHPDLILVNLGTNDAANVAKLSDDELNGGVTQAVNAFLTKLTTTHPDAQIVWCYGLVNQKLTATIKSAVESFGETNSKVSFIELPNQSTLSSTTGADSHPNVETNEKLADYIFKKLTPSKTQYIHSQLDYTVPVLTTEDVEGNTIHTLAQSKSNWSKYFTKDPSNLENNTGIHYEWVEGAGNGVANGINKKFDFDGASVKLANIGNAENAGSKRFALVFSSKNNTSYSATNGVLRILFNGSLGYATAAANGQSVNILGDDTATATDEKNAIFKNMSDKTVYVDIAKKADDTGDYEINLTIGDNVLTDTLPASLLTGLDFDPAGQCYITLSAVNITGQAATSIDFLGVGNSKAQVLAYTQAGLYLDGEEPTAIKSAAIVKNGSLINNYGSATQSSQGIELTVKATYGFGNGMEISVNGFSLKMSETGFILNGETINVALNDIGVYDIIFKVEPIFSNNGTTNTLITANINGVIYSSVSELVSEKTYEGIVIDNRYSGTSITLIPTAIMTLKGESEFVIDRVKHVLYVSDETDINVIKEKLDTTGFAFADGTVKTGMTVTRSGCAVYTVSLKDDVNGDGFVNVIDLVRLKKAAAQAVTLTDAQEYSVGIADTGVVKAENLNGMRKVILQS